MYTTNGSSSSSSSSRKGKKNNVSSENSKARKQPQRGLGVAQLEKIRILHSQLHHHHQPPPPYFNYNEDPRLLQTPSYSHNSYAFQPHTMNISEYERTNIRYGDSHQPSRWQHGNVNVNHYSPPQTNTTQPYLNLNGYDVILECFQQQDPSLMEKIRDCIVDYAPVANPDPQVWDSGFSVEFLKKNSVATKGRVSTD